MAFIIRILEKNGLLLFFLLLQIIAVVLIFTRNSMQRSWLAAQTAAINSFVSGYIDEGASYLQLKQENEKLVAQNKALMEALYGKEFSQKATLIYKKDTLDGTQTYSMIDGDIVFNSINRKDNYFTINRGKIHGVMPKMGVIAPQGIAGIVINTTDEYALVQSVLSVNKMRINAALKNAGYFGTLTWKGDNARIMHLADVPKYVPIAVGDTVITDGKSAIFPKGVMIGRVAGYEVDTKTGYWDISVELSEKMGNIRKVYVVRNLKKEKIQKIQDTLKATIKRENDE